MPRKNQQDISRQRIQKMCAYHTKAVTASLWRQSLHLVGGIGQTTDIDHAPPMVGENNGNLHPCSTVLFSQCFFKDKKPVWSWYSPIPQRLHKMLPFSSWYSPALQGMHSTDAPEACIEPAGQGSHTKVIPAPSTNLEENVPAGTLSALKNGNLAPDSTKSSHK